MMEVSVPLAVCPPSADPVVKMSKNLSLQRFQYISFDAKKRTEFGNGAIWSFFILQIQKTRKTIHTGLRFFHSIENKSISTKID